MRQRNFIQVILVILFTCLQTSEDDQIRSFASMKMIILPWQTNSSWLSGHLRSNFDSCIIKYNYQTLKNTDLKIIPLFTLVSSSNFIRSLPYQSKHFCLLRVLTWIVFEIILALKPVFNQSGHGASNINVVMRGQEIVMSMPSLLSCPQHPADRGDLEMELKSASTPRK